MMNLIQWIKKLFSKQVCCENKQVKDSKLFGTLMNYKMDKLRKLGKNFGALDTKKSELVEEIIEKVPNQYIMKFILKR